MTMVIATHEMAFARDVATSVCFLHEGRILEQGPPDADLHRPARGADPAVPGAGAVGGRLAVIMRGLAELAGWRAAVRGATFCRPGKGGQVTADPRNPRQPGRR